MVNEIEKKEEILKPAEVVEVKEIKKEESIKKDSAQVTLDELKSLLEKNLKWSQIIYEQNRKINRKLMWQALSGWFRVLLVVVPLLIALWFLPSYLGQFINKYGYLFGANKTPAANQSPTTVDQLLKLLPLDPAKQEQLKTILK